MNRPHAILALAALGGAPLVSMAQQPRKLWRIGFLVDGVTATNRQRIVELTAKQRLPAIYEIREFVDGGGLMSYGMNMNRQYERTADFMHRIFKGAKPADLPVEQPTKFELVINRRTAKALGLAIPPSLLQRADEVIQ